MTTYDAIIIGSGAGGAPVAQRLGAAGMNVLVVERGKRFDKDDFALRDEVEWCRRDRFNPSILTDPHTRRTLAGFGVLFGVALPLTLGVYEGLRAILEPQHAG